MNKGAWKPFLFGSVFVLSSVAALAAEKTPGKWPQRSAGSSLTLTEPSREDQSVPQQLSTAVIGGSDAAPGEFPMVVSIQRGVGDWPHFCAGVILSPYYVLTAAVCVNGVLPENLSVVAGLDCRSDPQNVVVRDVLGYNIHENYGVGLCTFPNDLAILTLNAPLPIIGGLIEAAALPPDDSDSFLGHYSVMAGWGSILPDCLRKADNEVISSAEANALLSNVTGARVCENQLAVYNRSQPEIALGARDRGGPVLVPCARGYCVAGIISWGFSTGQQFDPTYPIVTTRVSAYLQWILANTP